MFKTGDKVVCINNKHTIPLVLNEIYIIQKIISIDENLQYLRINNEDYNFKRFISLNYDRKRKIDKIRLNLNKKEL